LFGEAEIGVIDFRVFETVADELGLVVSALSWMLSSMESWSSIWVEKVEHIVLVSMEFLFNVQFLFL
jgi:hypothetical protein